MLMCYEATGLQQVQGLRNLRRGLLSYAARIRLWLWALLLRVLSRYLGIGAGDEVITSAYTYTASASPAVHVGATLKFIDVAPDSFEMDYEALEAAITEKTKVIVPVDIAGVPCDYDRILDIVKEKRLFFIRQTMCRGQSDV